MLKPVNDLLEFLAKAFGEYLWKKFRQLPLAIAESVPLTRTVTLAGFALLSTGFVSFAVHVARVQEEIRLTEDYARDTSQSVELLFVRASAVAEIAKDLLRRQQISLQGGNPSLQVETLLRLSEADGLAVVVAGRPRFLRGGLDSSITSPEWNEQRWSELTLKINRALQGKNEPSEPRVYSDMVGIILTFDVSSFEKVNLGALFDEFGGIAAKLKEEGWLVSHWSLHSLFACRPLKEKGESHSQPWTPSRIVEYFNDLKPTFDEKSLEDARVVRMKSLNFRITYGIGDLRVHAFRTGSMRQAVIYFYGDCLTDALHLEETLIHSDSLAWGGLYYSPTEADSYGFAPFGEESVSRGVTYRRIALGTRVALSDSRQAKGGKLN